MGAEADGPLLILARRLRSLGQPPSLAALLSHMEEGESYEEFVALVREYLPEREGDILGRSGPADQIAAFADRFEDRYFPLHHFLQDVAEGYADLTDGIPLVVMGLDWEDYHDLPAGYGGHGLLLLTYLMEDPYGEDDGARIPIGEACAAHVPIELLRRVPPGGIGRDEAHRLFDDTPYRALAHWADMLHYETGNFFLDTTNQELWECGFPSWDREEVEEATRQWRQAEEIQQEVNRLVGWLEEDPSAHFGEVLDFLAERKGMVHGSTQS